MKDKINVLMHKYLMIPIYVLGLVALLGFFRGCSTNKELSRTKKEVVTLQSEVDSLTTVIKDLPKLEDIMLEFEIEGYRISKRTLYDQNAIVRTTIRPDDRMNEYDQEIKKLQDQRKK